MSKTLLNASEIIESGSSTPKPPNELEYSVPKLAYSIREAAQALGVSQVTVYRLLKRGLIRSSSAFRHKLIPIIEIERFLKATLS